MSILHSLHGGNHDSVLKRRSDLRDLISEGIKNKSLRDYQIGLIIHAFADSYAHTMVKDGQLSAFGYIWGHLFHGHEPDLIVYDPENYNEYACELYKALSLKTSCSPELERLQSMIRKLETNRNDELPEFERYAYDLRYDYKVYWAKGKEWNKSVTKEHVKKTFEIIEAKISD